MQMKYLLAGPMLALAACTSVPTSETLTPPKAITLSVLHQSNRYGNLEPCGCSISPFGGIDREANAVKAIRAKQPNVLYVDAGNLLFNPEVKSTKERRQLRANMVSKILGTMKLDVFSPGPWDYQLGVNFLRDLASKSAFPFVSTNVGDAEGKPLFAQYAIVERNGLKIAILAVSPPDLVEGPVVKTEDPIAAIQKILPEVQKKASYIVVLSQLGQTKDYLLAEQTGVHLVVGSDPSVFVAASPANEGKALIVDNGDRGYQLGQINVQLKFPFVGYNSKEPARDQAELIAALEKKKNKDKATNDLLVTLKIKQSTPLKEGGSWYSASLIDLDEKRYGAPNEITKMKTEEGKALRKQALSE